LKYTSINWPKMHLNYPTTMVGEHFEIYFPQMAKNHLNCPPRLENIFEIYFPQWLKIHLNFPPWLEKFLKYHSIKWLKIHLNCPPRLEKFLKYPSLKWLKMHLNCPPCWRKICNCHFQDTVGTLNRNSRNYDITKFRYYINLVTP